MHLILRASMTLNGIKGSKSIENYNMELFDVFHEGFIEAMLGLYVKPEVNVNQ